MLRLDNGQSYFFQWDVNRKVIVSDLTVREVHFSNEMMDEALVVNTRIENGQNVANVPDVLLQQDYDVMCYVMLDSCTKFEKIFGIFARPKPTDYIYTEEEIKGLDDLYERVMKLEENPGLNPEGTILEQLRPIEEISNHGHDTKLLNTGKFGIYLYPKADANNYTFMLPDKNIIYLLINDINGNMKIMTQVKDVHPSSLFHVRYENNILTVMIGVAEFNYIFDENGNYVGKGNVFTPACKSDIVTEERIQEMIDTSLPPSGEEVEY